MGRWQYLGNTPFEGEERDTRTQGQKEHDKELRRISDECSIERVKKKRELFALWNESGQYVKIGTFVFPFACDDYLLFSDTATKYYSVCFITERQFAGGPPLGEGRSFYRLKTADAQDPWLEKTEFEAKTGISFLY